MLFHPWKAKRDTAYGEKPEAVKTHLRNMVIVFLGRDDLHQRRYSEIA